MATMKPQPIENVKNILDALPTKYAALAALGIATGGRIRELLTLRRIDLIDPERMEMRDEITLIKLKTHRKSTAAKIEEIKGEIEDLKAPRNYRGERLDHKPGQPKRKTAQQYRHITIPDGLKKYIAAHLNEEARRGFIRPKQYVFRGHTPGKPMQRTAANRMFTRKLGAGFGTHWMRKTYAMFMFETFLKKYNGETIRALKEVQELLGHAQLDSTAHYLQIDSENRQETIKNAFDAVFPRE